MPVLPLFINGREYQIACGEGEEARLDVLAGEVESRIQKMMQPGAPAGDPQLMLLTALSLADELYDVRDQLHTVSSDVENMKNSDRKKRSDTEQAVAATLSDIAARIERIAENVEKA